MKNLAIEGVKFTTIHDNQVYIISGVCYGSENSTKIDGCIISWIDNFMNIRSVSYLDTTINENFERGAWVLVN